MDGQQQAAPKEPRRERDGTLIVGPDDEFEMVRKLGAGSYGTAFLERNLQTKELVAIKYMRREHVTREIRREIINHRRLQHPHIIAFKKLLLTPTHCGVVMEHASGGELYKFVSALWARGAQLSENKARCLFQQLISGVAYLHSMEVVHRDLKLENTLLVPGTVPQLKICDFGFSKAQDIQSETSTMVGTASYMAPELVPAQLGGTYTGKAYNGKKVDCWACGVFLYAIMFAAYPFGSDSDDSLPHRIVKAKYTLPPGTPVSPQCQDLFQRIFTPNPDLRISVEEIMQHPWYLHKLAPDLLPDAVMAKNQVMETQLQSLEVISAMLDECDGSNKRPT